MNKADFVAVLKDSGLLISAKKEEEKKDGKGAPAEQKEEVAAIKFEEADVYDCIASCHSFDDDMLTYIDFLEALVRIAAGYPLSEE